MGGVKAEIHHCCVCIKEGNVERDPRPVIEHEGERDELLRAKESTLLTAVIRVVAAWNWLRQGRGC